MSVVTAALMTAFSVNQAWLCGVCSGRCACRAQLVKELPCLSGNKHASSLGLYGETTQQALLHMHDLQVAVKPC
jgi:hypothetical protein